MPLVLLRKVNKHCICLLSVSFLPLGPIMLLAQLLLNHMLASVGGTGLGVASTDLVLCWRFYDCLPLLFHQRKVKVWHSQMSHMSWIYSEECCHFYSALLQHRLCSIPESPFKMEIDLVFTIFELQINSKPGSTDSRSSCFQKWRSFVHSSFSAEGFCGHEVWSTFRKALLKEWMNEYMNEWMEWDCLRNLCPQNCMILFCVSPCRKEKSLCFELYYC